MKVWRSGETEWVTEQSDDHSLRRRRSTVCSTSDSSPSLSSSSESDQGLSLSLSLYTLSNSLSQCVSGFFLQPFLFLFDCDCKVPKAGLRRRKQLGIALAAVTASESSPSEGEMKSSLLLFPLALLLWMNCLIFFLQARMIRSSVWFSSSPQILSCTSLRISSLVPGENIFYWFSYRHLFNNEVLVPWVVSYFWFGEQLL